MNWMEILGYVASVITAISLMMVSVVKLRWVNLFGSTLFGIYGLMIGAVPVAGLNFFIAAINIFYLWKIHTEKQHFQIIEISTDDKFLGEFIRLNQTDIKKYCPEFTMAGHKDIVWMIHRNLSMVGLFVGHLQEETTLVAELDFVLPNYRDLKPGHFLFSESRNLFQEKGFKKIISVPAHPEHTKYLKKIGFQLEAENYVLNL